MAYKKSSNQKLYLVKKISFYFLWTRLLAYSNSLQDSIKDVDIIATIRTDHSAILHLQELEECKRGTGFWKMNTLLLTDEIFVQKMNEESGVLRYKSCLGLDEI